MEQQADNRQETAVREYPYELYAHISGDRSSCTEQAEEATQEQATSRTILWDPFSKGKGSENERKAQEDIPRQQLQRVRRRWPDQTGGAELAHGGQFHEVHGARDSCRETHAHKRERAHGLPVFGSTAMNCRHHHEQDEGGADGECFHDRQ